MAEPLSLDELETHQGYLRQGRLAGQIADRLLDERRVTAQQSQAALAVSIARSFDQAVANLLLRYSGINDPADCFHWLTRQYLINPNAPAYSYYDLVRDVLRAKLANDDSALENNLHQILLGYYEKAILTSGAAERVSKFAIEASYHALSLSTDNILPLALHRLFSSLPNGYQYTPHWSRMFQQIAAERTDLAATTSASLRRLASVLAASWRQGAPLSQSGNGYVCDPAMNVFFTSFHQGAAPDMQQRNAELWLAYFECRVASGARFTSELERATGELERIWAAANVLEDDGTPDRLLRFCAACDLSDAYNRRSDISVAITWSNQALTIARLDASPMRQAFALVLLSANLKRQGVYGEALHMIDQAIELVRNEVNPAASYYLGRFLFDKGVTLTYLSQTHAAEQAYEASRRHFVDISPQSIAELSGRLGWMKRLRGDLPGALADHDLGIQQFDDLLSGFALRVQDGASSLQYLRAKVLHSKGNVMREMCDHVAALNCYAAAMDVFAREGGIRLEAITRKDSAWSAYCISGPVAAQEQLLRSLADLGEGEGEPRDERALHSATHRAEGWLTLCLVRLCCKDVPGAGSALARAEEIANTALDDPLLKIHCTLHRALSQVADGQSDAAARSLDLVDSYIARATSQLWYLAADASVVRAVALHLAGDSSRARTQLAQARREASRWNEYRGLYVNEVWNGLTQSAQPNRDVHGFANYGELLSIYDQEERPLGLATSKLAHKIGLWHQSFHAWVIGHDDEGVPFVILQQRGTMKRDFPNCLDISVAGHYRAGEGIEGGVREFKEELGVDIDPRQLVLVARRTIDEGLDNGVVNREFQNIYALIRDPGLGQYGPGYPEVSAIYQCQLDKLRSLLDGTLERFECSGLAADTQSGTFRRSRREITLGNLIPSSHHYLTAVLIRLSRLLNEGVVAAEAEVQLPDGSYWKSS